MNKEKEIKDRLTFYINNMIREYDIYDMELLDLLEKICRSAYEEGTCDNEYLEALKKVGKNDK